MNYTQHTPTTMLSYDVESGTLDMATSTTSYEEHQAARKKDQRSALLVRRIVTLLLICMSAAAAIAAVAFFATSSSSTAVLTTSDNNDNGAAPAISAVSAEALEDRRLLDRDFGIGQNPLMPVDEDYFAASANAFAVTTEEEEQEQQDQDQTSRSRRRLGRFHGGVVLPEPVRLSDEITAGSTSVPHGKTFSDGIEAHFGGAEQCCDATTYEHPTTTVRWSSWAEGQAAIDANEEVVVPCGTHVVLDASPSAPLKGLRIRGTLTVADEGADIEVQTGYVYNCGVLRANLQQSRDTPLTHLTFTLVGHEQIPGAAGFSTKAFVTKGGDIDLRGNLCNQTTWTTLAATADAGATELRLDGTVTWPVGTELMVASTDFQGTQTEVVTVAAVLDGGSTLRLKNGLVYPHAGVAPITAEVAALSRNIKITSEAACAAIPNAEADNKPMCGHFVIDHTPRGVVCGVEVTNMGKHTTTGKYPMHAHMCGDAPELQIRSNAVHSNHHRALVIHGTSNATWVENVVFRSVGHLLLTEDGGEEGNKILRNVLALPKRPSPGWPSQCPGVVPSKYGGCEVHRCSHGTGIYEAVCGNRHDGETAAMWISNPANHISYNRIIAGRAVGVRFETRGLTGRVALLSDEERRAFRVGAGRKSQGRGEGLGEFEGNVIHSSKHGIFNYPSWNPSDGILINNYVAWKNQNAVFAKTKYAYKNPNMADHRKYSLHNATLLMNKQSVYTIHDDSKLHVSKSILAPQLPAHLPLTAAASQDVIATAGACASDVAETMCSSVDYCTIGDGSFDDDDDSSSSSTTGTFDGQLPELREDVTDARACRKLKGGKWNKKEYNTFPSFEWREAVEGADGSVEKPFGDWYFNLPGKRNQRWFGKSSLELRRRAWCKERVHASTFKNGKPDATYRFPTQPNTCVGAMGASPSVARRASTPGHKNSHQMDIFKAFREGKHYVTGLPWSISVDEETLAGARANGYSTWEELGQPSGRNKRGIDGNELPRLRTAPLPCAAHGCYLQAAGAQAHLGSHNKGYIHEGARRRHRFPIVFPTAAAVKEMQRFGKEETCVSEGGKWELVFRQTAPFRFSAENDWAQARSYNAGHPDKNNYSILDQLERFRQEEGGAFTFKLEYPVEKDRVAFDTRKNGEFKDGAKMQENARVWRQTNNPTVPTTCTNDGKRFRKEKKNVETVHHGACGVEDFENVFPTEWVPLAGKWHGVEYKASKNTFISGATYRRFGESQLGMGLRYWTVGSAHPQGPVAGDSRPVTQVEMYACNYDPAAVGEDQQGEDDEDGMDMDMEEDDDDEEADGEWELVFRQTAPFMFARANDWANALSLNEDDEQKRNFSILNKLETYRAGEEEEGGAFRFKLRYPDSGKENIWEQQTNPAVKTTCKNNKGKKKTGNCGVDGYKPIAIDMDNYNWGGLEYNGRSAFIDGNIDANGSSVWYAVGGRQGKQGKRLQTYARDVVETSVELYAWKSFE